MEVAMTKQGTLKELNVKPGDVVVCVESGMIGFTSGKTYPVIESLEEAGVRDDDGDFRKYPALTTFRISRAAQDTTATDLTAITTPFGLLDAATQEALRAHGGPYEYFDGDEWCATDACDDIQHFAHRVKKQPEMAGFTIEYNGYKADAFVQIADGKPDWSTLQVKE